MRVERTRGAGASEPVPARPQGPGSVSASSLLATVSL